MPTEKTPLERAREYLQKTNALQETQRSARIEAAKARIGPGREELGLRSGTLLLVPYNAMWPLFFEIEKEALANLLGAKAAIEHVGSTSILGMPAKPIVDIAIGFRSYQDIEEAIPKLLRAKYRYIPEMNQVSQSKFFAKGQPRLFHIHLLDIGNAGWQKFIYFRDYLRSNYEIRAEYAALKQRLAKELQSIPGDSVRREYSRKKSGFLDIVSMRAIRQMRYRRYYKHIRFANENQEIKFATVYPHR